MLGVDSVALATKYPGDRLMWFFFYPDFSRIGLDVGRLNRLFQLCITHLEYLFTCCPCDIPYQLHQLNHVVKSCTKVVE